VFGVAFCKKRVETFRSPSALPGDDGQQLRCYFVYKCQFANPNPNALFVAGTIDRNHTGPTGVDVDSMVLGLFVQANLQLLIIAGIGGDFGGVLEEKGFFPSDFVISETTWFYNKLGIDDTYFQTETIPGLLVSM
jgi:hypothetical protein